MQFRIHLGKLDIDIGIELQNEYKVNINTMLKLSL